MSYFKTKYYEQRENIKFMQDNKQESIKKLNELIKDISIAMMTTIDGGVLRSRPMDTQEMDENGVLWFLTGKDSHKDEEIKKDNRVNVSYASNSKSSYVSVSGTGAISNDREKIAELWSPEHKAWFPEGKDDPNIRILKVNVEQAEYWDASSNTFVQAAGFLKALVTGERTEGGENEKINM